MLTFFHIRFLAPSFSLYIYTGHIFSWNHLRFSCKHHTSSPLKFLSVEQCFYHSDYPQIWRFLGSFIFSLLTAFLRYNLYATQFALGCILLPSFLPCWQRLVQCCTRLSECPLELRSCRSCLLKSADRYTYTGCFFSQSLGRDWPTQHLLADSLSKRPHFCLVLSM